MIKASVVADRPFFHGTIIGYILAIITTVVVMLVFEHGQPALLYLVPACLGSVLLTAAIKGELLRIWDFTEENFVDDEPDKKDK